MFFKLKVHAESRSAEISRKAADSFEIWVRAPAERGLANAEALNSLAQALGVNAARLRIVKGSTSPNKIVKRLG